LAGVAHRTPVVTSTTLDERLGATVLLKCESFQRTGSFKFRGAYNLMASMDPAQRARGVCTVSSGNHAQAVALSAQLLHTTAAILMPSDAPSAKVEATRAYGADIEFYDRRSMPQVEAGARFQAQRGLPFVTAYDDARISAGAGTATLELFEDGGPIDILVAPVGGGGGMAGHATVAKALAPGCRIVGVEPAAGGTMKRSLAAGERLSGPVPDTIADGLMLTTPGAFTFSVLRELVDEVVLVEDSEIVQAMALLFSRLKLVTEPTGAIALAALLSGKVAVAGHRVGVIVTGGNVGLDRFLSLMRGRGESGR